MEAVILSAGGVLFYCVGIGFVDIGIVHAYVPQVAASAIGWQPSPFEYELAAAAGHIPEIQCCHNYAPANAGLTLWFGDIFLPVVLVMLAVLSGDDGYSRGF